MDGLGEEAVRGVGGRGRLAVAEHGDDDDVVVFQSSGTEVQRSIDAAFEACWNLLLLAIRDSSLKMEVNRSVYQGYTLGRGVERAVGNGDRESLASREGKFVN